MNLCGVENGTMRAIVRLKFSKLKDTMKGGVRDLRSLNIHLKYIYKKKIISRIVSKMKISIFYDPTICLKKRNLLLYAVEIIHELL